MNNDDIKSKIDQLDQTPLPGSTWTKQKGWEAIQGKKAIVTLVPVWLQRVSVAAGLLLLFGVSFWQYNQQHQRKVKALSASLTAVEQENNCLYDELAQKPTMRIDTIYKEKIVVSNAVREQIVVRTHVDTIYIDNRVAQQIAASELEFQRTLSPLSSNRTDVAMLLEAELNHESVYYHPTNNNQEADDTPTDGQSRKNTIKFQFFTAKEDRQPWDALANFESSGSRLIFTK